VWMLEKRPYGVADEVCGGFEPSSNQEEDHAHELEGGERLSRLFGLDQGTGEVVFGFASAAGQELSEIVLQVGGHLLQGVKSSGGDQGVEPGSEALLVLYRDADQLGEHSDGQWERQCIQQVSSIVVSEVVEQALGRVDDDVAYSVDLAGSERLGDKGP